MAAKVAVAAVAALLLGNLLPGELGDYGYYAALGAVLSMTPTLVDAVRAGLKTTAGVALGVLIAALAVQLPGPMWVAIVVALAVAVVVAGIPWLGAGRDYVSIAALFALIVGGPTNMADYSTGYLVQLALGFAIGIAINLLILPPMRGANVRSTVDTARAQAAAIAERLAAAGDSAAKESAEETPGEDPDVDGEGRPDRNAEGTAAAGGADDDDADRSAAGAEAEADTDDGLDDARAAAADGDGSEAARDIVGDNWSPSVGQRTGSTATDASGGDGEAAKRESSIQDDITAWHGTLSGIDQDILDARESRRANPRARVHKRDLDFDASRIQALRRMVDQFGAAARLLGGSGSISELPTDAIRDVADAHAAISRALTDDDEQRTNDALAALDDAAGGLQSRLDGERGGESIVAIGGAILVLRREREALASFRSST